MSKCPQCKRAKCKWIDLKDDPSKVPEAEIAAVIAHNNRVIEVMFSGNNGSNGSAYAEERMYNRLQSYAEELEKRAAK